MTSTRMAARGQQTASADVRRPFGRTGGVLVLLMLVATAASATEGSPADEAQRQTLDDAWWTGPILAASASTLPAGHFLIEPYVFDVSSHERFDDSGERQRTSRTDSFGSLTYLLYGLTDELTVGVIPRFGFNRVSGGKDSSGIGLGDVTLQAQYRLTQFRQGSPLPTISVVLQETLPIGKHDRLGERPSDGMGSGAYATTLALYLQHFFWMPNGRILRTRFNVAHTFSDDANIDGVSVYGTENGFHGQAEPGDSLAVNLAGEYSVTRNWVLALDVFYQRDDSTRVDGHDGNGDRVFRTFGTSRRVGIAPAIEYNWSSRVGVIVGARWITSGRNADVSVTPVAAINLVY